jgi:hypothetical protein
MGRADAVNRITTIIGRGLTITTTIIGRDLTTTIGGIGNRRDGVMLISVPVGSTGIGIGNRQDGDTTNLTGAGNTTITASGKKDRRTVGRESASASRLSIIFVSLERGQPSPQPGFLSRILNPGF